MKKIKVRADAKPMVDYDYTDKLSPDEQAWLEKFTRSYYNSFETAKTSLFSDAPEAQRSVWAADNARRRDIWNNSYRVGLSDELTDLGRDPAPFSKKKKKDDTQEET